MKTNFFSLLKEKGISNLNMVISADDNGNFVITTAVTSLVDDANKKLRPLELKGNSKDLDTHFFETISKPIQDANEFISNIEDYHADLEQRKKETKEAKDKADKLKKLKENLEDLAKDVPKNKDKILSKLTDYLSLTKKDNFYNDMYAKVSQKQLF